MSMTPETTSTDENVAAPVPMTRAQERITVHYNPFSGEGKRQNPPAFLPGRILTRPRRKAEAGREVALEARLESKVVPFPTGSKPGARKSRLKAG
jgi:hypothetical protein